MLQAFALGAIAQSSLLLSGVIPYVTRIPDRIIGILAGVGAGALIAAVAFDLVPEALDVRETALWFLVGAGIFLVADHVIERRFGADGAGGALGIVLGSVVDGVPESLIFGIQLAAGVPLSVAFLAAVFVSNIPQALAPSADLMRSGWPIGRMVTLWGSVVIACGVAAALGFLLASDLPDVVGARAAAIAAGGLLAMLAASLVPFAYEKGGPWAALATVVGFCASMSQT
jgi:ZIP family zinc transporter